MSYDMLIILSTRGATHRLRNTTVQEIACQTVDV